jgi:hypothetical protein
MLDRYKKFDKDEVKRELKKGRETNLSEKAVVTFLNLWKWLGMVGFLLPLVLLFGTCVNRESILPSISDYFYTSLNIVFTASLILITLFLFANNVNNPTEKIVSRIAAICATCTVIFPTPALNKYQLNDSKLYSMAELDSFVMYTIPSPKFVGVLHFISAGLFFISLIFLIFYVFIKEEAKSANSLKIRITIYKYCGFIMILSIFTISIIKLFGESIFDSNPNEWIFPFVFLFELIALFAFGASWLVRGHVLQEFLEDI